VQAGVEGGVPGTKENKPAKVLKQRREGGSATGRRGRGRARGRERLSWGATEMAAMYQASRSDAQTCIGRRVGRGGAEKDEEVKKQAQGTIWREGEGVGDGGG
jgi:hypothetical protein